MGYSLGIGLTNDCNLSCAHCYRETDRIDHITLEQIRRICEAIDIESVGMGTGENALNPEFIRIVSYLANRRVKLSVASNGYTLTSIPEEILSAFHDVEVSIDFPTQAEQDAFRGPGNWMLVHRAIERCQLAGVEVSILATMMRVNYDKMDRLVSLARQNGVNLRVNAYQAVKTDAYRLAYEVSVMKRIFGLCLLLVAFNASAVCCAWISFLPAMTSLTSLSRSSNLAMSNPVLP